MLITKIVGAALVLSSAAMAVMCMCRRESMNIRLLQNIYNAYRELAADIRTGYTSLPDAFANICLHGTDKITCEYFRTLSEQTGSSGCVSVKSIVDAAVDSIYSEYLPEKDKSLIKEIGGLPVHLDVGIQTEYIEALTGRIGARIDECVQAAATKCRIYKTVGFCAGSVIVIIFM